MASLSLDGLQKLLEDVGETGPLPLYDWADVQNSAMDIFVSYLTEYIVQKTGCEGQVAHESIQWPNELGDLVIVIPRLRLTNSEPRALAAKLAADPPASPLFAQPFDDDINLRFMFSEQALSRVLIPYILDRGSQYGRITSLGIEGSEPTSEEKKKKVIVEFSSPNIGKAFDGAHLRSTIAGVFIAAIHERMGWDVCRLNNLGDWGKHIGLLAAGWALYGSDNELAINPLRHLLEVFTKISASLKEEQGQYKESHQAQEGPHSSCEGPISAEKDNFFKRMEDSEPEALNLWTRFRDSCIREYQQLYARMNVRFDAYSGESEVSKEVIVEVESALKDHEVIEESDQAWIIDFAKHGHPGLGTAIVRYRNGTTSYLLRDIATALDRQRKHSFDKMIYVVSARQTSHFKQLVTALDLMGQNEMASKVQHVGFGKDKGLSAREGTSGLLLGDILDQSQLAVETLLEQDLTQTKVFTNPDPRPWTPDELGALALMTQDLSGKRAGTFTVEPSKFATVEGNTILHLQTWLIRLEETIGEEVADCSILGGTCVSVFEDEACIDMLRHLIKFPSVARTGYKSLESSPILAYLYQAVDLLPALMCDGLSEETEGSHLRRLRLLCLAAARQVLWNGLDTLGLSSACPAR